jgi:hypothetical protein
MDTNNHGWLTGPAAWSYFVQQHPELGYKPGRMNLHNFLRYHRRALLDADAIRLAKRKYWIAHRERFCGVAFACATGKLAAPEGH